MYVSEKLTDFRQLNVWQKANKLVLDTYELTKKFPKEERNDMVARMRVAACNIPIQIAQGFMQRRPRDKSIPYKGTLESLETLKYYLLLSEELGYVRDNTAIFEAAEEVGRMLTGLIRSVKGEAGRTYESGE